MDSLMPGEDGLDFNFWPSFADTMLALVFVLVLVLFAVAWKAGIGKVNIAQVEAKQEEVEKAVLAGIAGCLDGSAACPIEAQHDLHVQRFTFADQVLFPSNEYRLSAQGEALLNNFSREVRKHILDIDRIEVTGHTDIVPTTRYRDNLELGALRALTVLRFFQTEGRIDPNAHLMSAASYGEFKPVARPDTGLYNARAIRAQNASDALKASNRRVEVLLYYKH